MGRPEMVVNAAARSGDFFSAGSIVSAPSAPWEGLRGGLHNDAL